MAVRGGIYSAHPSKRFEVGDLVSCDWKRNGRVTVHRIVEKRIDEQCSQTGTVFQVKPSVHPPDHSNPFSQGWIDAAWFFVDGLETL